MGFNTYSKPTNQVAINNMITVSVSMTPAGAALGVLVIGAGVALGIGTAHVLKENSAAISNKAKALFGKKATTAVI